MKAASQQLSGMKWKKKIFLSYQSLKIHKHSINIGLSCSDFSLNLLKQFFYIQNHKMCSSKKILY